MNRDFASGQAASGKCIYSLRDVGKHRGNQRSYRVLLRHLMVAGGDKIAITGPSGCGKSTTLDILGLGLEPDSAERFLFNPLARTNAISVMDLWHAGRGDALADLRLGSMGYVLQTGDLLPYLNTADNIMLPCVLAGMDRAKASARAKDLAVRLGLGNLLAAMPSTLSIGERQRAAIARALAPHPPVILADEPTAALDPLHAAKVMDMFLEAVEELGSTLILVTHNERWAQKGRLKILRFRITEDEGCVTAILDDRETDFDTGA